MSHIKPGPKRARSKAKKWMINLFILIIATILILALGESLVRWIDGYQLTTLKLNQDNATLQQTE